MRTAQEGLHPLFRILFAVPLLGWLLRDALLGHDDAKIYFIVNCLVLWVLAIVLFGYPAAIIPALAAVPVVFVILIAITRG